MVIAVCNEKGGSGKTNIAINLAIKLGLMKDDTLLVDADPQRSIDVFTDIRADANLPLLFNAVSKLGSSMLKEIQSLKQKYDSVVIDTGGRDSQEMRQALAVCNIRSHPFLLKRHFYMPHVHRLCYLLEKYLLTSFR